MADDGFLSVFLCACSRDGLATALVWETEPRRVVEVEVEVEVEVLSRPPSEDSSRLSVPFSAEMIENDMIMMNGLWTFS